MSRSWALFLMMTTSMFVPAFLFAAGPDSSRVLKEGASLGDARLGQLRTLNDKYHPWVPAASKVAWEKQAKAIRERVLVSSGLWPMPPKEELKPVIHGKIDRGEYTIEKVYFASHPGHYVTGNLYRSTKKSESKHPGVLCPHGHWAEGRFYDAGVEKGRGQIDAGAERDMSGARYSVQARMAQLARMGCVVFHYDMTGYADSKQIDHREGFRDVEAGLRLQNFLGLQTFNSVRALDFLTSLTDVDPERIAVTGSSGGGTQTFMLCGIDPRPKVAFPAVMVSTAMQGGCVCENAEYLRVGINNVAIAALFAPKPLAMSGANDWTIDIETKGLPELKQVYGLYGNADLVEAKAYPQFGHNYNRVAREMMYHWLNAHLNLGSEGSISEEDFWPVDPQDLSVFDEEHQLPADVVSVEALRNYLTILAKKQFDALLPSTPDQVPEYQRVVGTAARVMLDDGVPSADSLGLEAEESPLDAGLNLIRGFVIRKQAEERVPFVVLATDGFVGPAVLWLDGKGKSHLFGSNGQPTESVKRLLDSGHAVVSADLFLTGEFVKEGEKPNYPSVNEDYQGYTFGYNRTVVANRVRDVLTMIGALEARDEVQSIKLVGTGEAGPWVLLAAGLAGDHVEQTVADARGFRFSEVKTTSDPAFLPGALKYGGLPGLAALAAPRKLTVMGMSGISEAEREPLSSMYAASDGELLLREEPLSSEAVAEHLLR